MTQHLSPGKPLPRAIAGLIGLALMTGSIATRWLDPAAAAAQLNGKGVFAMGDAWMPCSNGQALHKALQNE
jgi:hypothetical protein